MQKQWSKKKRNAQREYIIEHQPWNKSTGPKSDEGKSNSSRNAYKGKTPIRSMQKILRTIHKERLEILRWLENTYNIKVKF